MPTHSVNGYDDYNGTSTILEKIGANTESFLERSFEKWGKQCAERPWLILFVGMCAVIAFGCGVKSLAVTTDPVELWASPTSRGRIEREYFDSHFEPFYRTEQIIIKAVGLDNIIHKTSDGPIEFGPAFNDSFLKSVLELQEHIKGIGAGTEHGLDKICFAPLRSKGQASTDVEECVVQSVWGYFQDSLDNFEITRTDPEGYEINYLDNILACTQ